MVAIPIISGIYADVSPDFRTAYPVNMVPVPKAQGISEGYLSIADGIVQNGTGYGADRGGILWNGTLYRVSGSNLISISANGSVTLLGDVGAGADVSMSYSFDHLAIASAGKLWLWNGTFLAQNVDPDLGIVLDVEWVDGYFVTTDGEFIVVTELNNPFSVNPLKYGSSEVDPDPITSILKLRREAYALNRHTIEVFQNVGGDLFPFQRVEGAQINRGVIGARGAAVFMDSIAFLGSGRNESPSVWVGSNGVAQKIATREIDTLLQGYTELQLAAASLEVKLDKGHETLFVHLPDMTLCFDGAATQAAGQPVWYVLGSGITQSMYLARHLVWAYDRWTVGHATGTALGYMTRSVFTHWGAKIGWQFSTPIVFMNAAGAQFHELELICLTGSTAFGSDPTISASYSVDGVTWSQEKYIKAGMFGGRNKPLKWLRQGIMRKWRVQRFTGTSDAPLTVARLEAKIEPLAW